MNKSEKRLTTISWFFISLSLFIWLFPIIWFALASFKNPKNLYDIFSFEFSLYNYREVFNTYPIATYMKNSLILAISATLFAVTIGTLIAYGLSHTRFRFKTQTTVFIFLLRLIPGMAVMVPLFIIFSSLGLTKRISAQAPSPSWSVTLPLMRWACLTFTGNGSKDLPSAGILQITSDSKSIGVP